MNKLMTELFDLACKQVWGYIIPSFAMETESFWMISGKGDMGYVELYFFKFTKAISFSCDGKFLHVNQYPLYERLSEFTERGV